MKVFKVKLDKLILLVVADDKQEATIRASQYIKSKLDTMKARRLRRPT